MSKRIIYSIFALALALVMTQSAFSAEKASAALKEAIAVYTQGQYANALEKLNSLSGADASSELTRYYKALCYQQTNQFEAAQKEYYWLYSHGQDASLKYKAWQGLKSVSSRTKNTANKNASASGTETKGTKTAKAEKTSGQDSWITPGEDYGYSGPPPTTSFTFIRRQKACGRR